MTLQKSLLYRNPGRRCTLHSALPRPTSQLCYQSCIIIIFVHSKHRGSRSWIPSSTKKNFLLACLKIAARYKQERNTKQDSPSDQRTDKLRSGLKVQLKSCTLPSCAALRFLLVPPPWERNFPGEGEMRRERKVLHSVIQKRWCKRQPSPSDSQR